jgi:type IV fimbrial biogenesis protein FimT
LRSVFEFSARARLNTVVSPVCTVLTGVGVGLGRRAARGWTLIEVCVSLAVVSVLAGQAAPGLQSWWEARRVDGVASELALDLQWVRLQALALNQAVRLSLQRGVGGGSCYVVHTREVGDCRCDFARERVVCEAGAQSLKGVFFPAEGDAQVGANVGSLRFDPLHGTATPAGTLSVRGARYEARLVVNLMGRVRACSPESGLAGYRTC